MTYEEAKALLERVHSEKSLSAEDKARVQQAIKIVAAKAFSR